MRTCACMTSFTPCTTCIWLQLRYVILCNVIYCRLQQKKARHSAQVSVAYTGERYLLFVDDLLVVTAAAFMYYSPGMCSDAHPWSPKGVIDPVVPSHRPSTADSQK